MTTILTTAVAAFLASFVEVVEAFTIILAVALTRGWRPALTGTVLALILLAIIVILFGPALALLPIEVVQLTVGVLLTLFGMRWLRKAILRIIGIIALRDEERAFAKERAELERQSSERSADYIAGFAAFKAVLLEGTEVIFIVIAIGTARDLTLVASLGALGAAVVVGALGLTLHRPLSQVPENTLKLVVGLMLTSFGIFWTGEGLGAEWPGGDLALIGIFAVLSFASWTIVGAARSGSPT